MAIKQENAKWRSVNFKIDIQKDRQTHTHRQTHRQRDRQTTVRQQSVRVTWTGNRKAYYVSLKARDSDRQTNRQKMTNTLGRAKLKTANYIFGLFT